MHTKTIVNRLLPQNECFSLVYGSMHLNIATACAVADKIIVQGHGWCVSSVKPMIVTDYDSKYCVTDTTI